MTEQIMININGEDFSLASLQDDVNASIEKGYGNHDFAFTRGTVQGLIDKINELSQSQVEPAIEEVLPIEEIQTTFTNGDVLTLKLANSIFAGYKPAKYYELVYGERCEGNYGDDEPTPGVHYFMTTNTEYFPESEKEKAILAFGKRAMSGNAEKSSDMGYRLDDFLEKEIVPGQKYQCGSCQHMYDIEELSTKYKGSYKYLCSSCELMVSGT